MGSEHTGVMLKGITRMIRIDLGEGIGRAVEAVVVGAYALHPQHGGKPEAPGWAITHVRSGLQIWRVRTPAEATAVAHWLGEHGPLPPLATKAELLAWVGGGSPGRGAALGAALRSIAPRWNGRTGKEEESA